MYGFGKRYFIILIFGFFFSKNGIFFFLCFVIRIINNGYIGLIYSKLVLFNFLLKLLFYYLSICILYIGKLVFFNIVIFFLIRKIFFWRLF